MKKTKTKQDAVDLVEKYEKYLFNKFTTDQEWVTCVESALIGIRQVSNPGYTGPIMLYPKAFLELYFKVHNA